MASAGAGQPPHLHLGLRKRLAHLLNRAKDEGALRNLLYEVNCVGKKMTGFVKQQAIAGAETTKWGEGESTVVSSFLQQLADLDKQLLAAEVNFVAQHAVYTDNWRAILTERKELKEMESALSKADHRVLRARSKLDEAEKAADKKAAKLANLGANAPIETHSTSQPSPAPSTPPAVPLDSPAIAEPFHHWQLKGKGPDVDLAEARLQATIVEHELIHKQVAEKVLEQHRETHGALRTGFYGLCAARLTLCKEVAFFTEKALQVVATLPNIIDFEHEGDDGDVSFIMAPYCDAAGPDMTPIWHHGEELMVLLSAERAKSRQLLADEHTEGQRLLASATQKAAAESGDLKTALASKDADYQARDQKTALLQADKIAAVQSTWRQVLDRVRAALDGLDVGNPHDPVAALMRELEQSRVDLDALLVNNDRRAPEACFVALSLACRILHLVPLGQALMVTLDSAASAELQPLLTALATASLAVHDDQLIFVAAPATLVAHANAKGQALLGALAAVEAFLRAKTLEPVSELPPSVQTAVHAAQQLIGDAFSSLEGLKTELQTRDKDDANKLAAHEALVENAFALVAKIRDTIDATLHLQSQLRVGGDGDSELTASERTALHRSWVRGVEAQVTQVVDSTPMWLDALRQLVLNDKKAPELQVFTRNLAASSALLLADARAKQTRSSTALQNVKKAADALIVCSHETVVRIGDCLALGVVGAVTDDYATLTDTQVKALTMATQLEVLHFEKSLSASQEKLRRLRRSAGAFAEQASSAASSAAKAHPTD